MLLDVRPDHLQIVQAILQKHVPQYAVWAFGSRAKWTAKDYSDLDLCIVSDKPLDFRVLGALAEDFSESDLPWKVDVVDWATTSEPFRKIIERDKVVVQQRKRGRGMSSEWPTVSISEIAATQPGSMAVGPFGSRMKADLYVASGVRVIRGNNLCGGREPEGNYVYVSEETADSLASCCLKAGDLVFPHRGNIGLVGITPDDGHRYMLSTSLMKLSPDRQKADPLYLMYFFKSPIGRAALLMNASQVGTPGIATPLKSLRGIQLPLPPLSIQREIAETLSTLDDRITLLRETNATLEAIAQALFKSWFVDFDPVRAKADGREPEGIPPEVADLFPSAFEDSPLGGIPKGWESMRLDQACEINPTRRLNKGNVAPYLEMAAIPTQGHRTEAPVSRAFSSGTKFMNGDTLLARITPCLENGKTAFVDFLDEDEIGWGSTEYIVLHPKPPLQGYWAYLLCRHNAFRQFAIQAMVGTSGRQRVEISRLAQFQVTLPSEEITSSFAATVEPIQTKIAANDNEAKTLATLRDTLLPRLMSGKLRIPETIA